MSYIIGNKCVSVCDTACVKVCPVNCIHGPIDINGRGMEVDKMSKEELIGKQLYINPKLISGLGFPEHTFGPKILIKLIPSFIFNFLYQKYKQR